MKNHIGVGVASLLIAASIIPAVALAASFRVGQQPNVPASEKITGDLYIAGGNVSSHGPVTGDLVIGGGNILVDSAVSQDLIVGGGSVTILSAVADDLRVGGGNIVISGSVKGDVVAAGGQTQISGVGIGGDVLWAGGVLRVEAPVTGNLTLRGGDVTIQSTVHGNVDFRGEKLTLGKNAVIDGNLTYRSPKEATMEEGAVVKGSTNYEPQKSIQGDKKGIATIISVALFGKFLSILACALVIGLLFRRYSAELLTIATSQPLTEMGRGVVVLIMLPIVSIILLVTLLGIPFGILGLLGFVAVLIFVSIVAPIILGSLVHKWVFKPMDYEVTWKTILLGVVLYTILGFIPILGWLCILLLTLLTVGSMVKFKWDMLKEWR